MLDSRGFEVGSSAVCVLPLAHAATPTSKTVVANRSVNDTLRRRLTALRALPSIAWTKPILVRALHLKSVAATPKPEVMILLYGDRFATHVTRDKRFAPGRLSVDLDQLVLRGHDRDFTTLSRHRRRTLENEESIHLWMLS